LISARTQAKLAKNTKFSC